MPNSLTNILDKILAMGLSTLREAAVMPRLTNADYRGEAAQKGATIDIPIPKAQVVGNVTPGPVRTSSASNAPGLVQVALDQWKKTNFFLTDKDMVEIDRNRHFVPMQTDEAARAMANNLDGAIHGRYLGVYGWVGTAGVTPFSTVATGPLAGKVLNEQLAPKSMRRIVLDPSGEAQALQLSAYSDVEKTQDRAVKIEGEIGRKFGFDHFMSQNVTSHTAGTCKGGTFGSTGAVGASTVELDGTSALGTLVVGDVFSRSGDPQTYVALTGGTISSAGINVRIDPPLKVAASAGTTWARKASHVVNLAFHPQAFAWATRPLQEAVTGEVQANLSRTMTDPLSGVTMRLEIIRENKQTAFEFDYLYGTKLVRPPFAARIAG